MPPVKLKFQPALGVEYRPVVVPPYVPPEDRGLIAVPIGVNKEFKELYFSRAVVELDQLFMTD
jgi:hypothetical protein